jgi:hypothetical protein
MKDWVVLDFQSANRHTGGSPTDHYAIARFDEKFTEVHLHWPGTTEPIPIKLEGFKIEE